MNKHYRTVHLPWASYPNVFTIMAEKCPGIHLKFMLNERSIKEYVRTNTVSGKFRPTLSMSVAATSTISRLYHLDTCMSGLIDAYLDTSGLTMIIEYCSMIDYLFPNFTTQPEWNLSEEEQTIRKELFQSIDDKLSPYTMVFGNAISVAEFYIVDSWYVVPSSLTVLRPEINRTNPIVQLDRRYLIDYTKGEKK